MYCGEINMKIKDSVKIKLLTLLCSVLLSIILLFASFRLIRRIANTFIYLTGLLTLFCGCILAVFLIWILVYIYLFGCKKYKRYHYSKFSNKKLSNEFIINLCLLILTLILLFICLK